MRGVIPDVEPSDQVVEVALACFGPAETLPHRVVLAVSGGSDSTALLRLAQWWWCRAGKQVIVLTVDHGLRPEASEEAQQVRLWCDALGLEHHILSWTYTGQGNVSAAAREGRYRLMAEWCRSHGIAHLYTAHTMDDQAETVLMRFARGAGVDGLAAMARETLIWDVTLVRPFLRTQTRDSLRAILSEMSQDWIDDPTNDDPQYDRIKARALLGALEPLGMSVKHISDMAYRMGLAKRVLAAEAAKVISKARRASSLGYFTLSVDHLARVETETGCRVIGETMKTLSGATFRAALSVEQQLLALAIQRSSNGGITQGGCLIRPKGDDLLILREPERCAQQTRFTDRVAVWDHRFMCEVDSSEEGTDLCIGAVGAHGLQQIPKDYAGFSKDWLVAPHEARRASPGVWRGDVLLAAPCGPWSSGPLVPSVSVRLVWEC